MQIYTSSFQNCKSPKGVAIVSDGGEQVGFHGKCLDNLAPRGLWLQEWHDNIGLIPEDENIAFYVKSYYDSVLGLFDAADLYWLIKDSSVLLSYEKPEEYSCRDVIAAYLELYFAKTVPEVAIAEDGTITKLKRNRYYKDIKDYLEGLIKKSIDMHGFECIAAAFAYEQSLNLEKAQNLSQKYPITPESYRRLAEVLEESYKSKSKQKK